MTILSELPDGMGYYYGFHKGDNRQINVRRGPVDILWRAYVGGERIGDDAQSVWVTKDEAERAAIQFIEANPREGNDE